MYSPDVRRFRQLAKPSQGVGWWLVTCAYAALIAVGAVVPVPPSASGAVGSLDKAIHLCEYFLFAWCIVRASRASRFSHAKTLAVALLWSVGWGMLLEGVQAWLPYRSAEWGDVAANVVGSSMGLWVGMKP